jgi:uncharacterized membrane protein YbhN (UPF0104 family)
MRETYRQLSTLSGGEAIGLMPAFGLMVTTVLGFAASWSYIVRSLEPKISSRAALVNMFLLTWPARYVPGTLPYHVTRIMLGERLGFRKSTLTAGIFYEAIIQVGAAVLLGFAALCIEFAIAGRSWVALAPFVPLLGLPLLLQPQVFVPLANAVLTRVGRRTLDSSHFLTAGQTTASLIGYLLCHIANGLACWSIALVVADSTISPLMVIGAYSIAAAAGVAIVFLPSGLGVREGALVAILSMAMPASEALAVATLARAVTIVGDFTPLFVVGSRQAAGAFAAFHRLAEPGPVAVEADPPTAIKPAA